MTGMRARRADLQPRDVSPSVASRQVWARDAPWGSEAARLAGLIEAVGVLLPAADADGDGDGHLAEMLRARRIEYVDELLAVRRSRGTVTG